MQTITYSQQDALRFKQEAERLAFENELMREEIRLLKAKRFGASSERSELNGQGILFNEAEALFSPTAIEPGLDTVLVKKRPRPKNKRALDLSGLPRRHIDYVLTDEELTCPQCGGSLHEMDIDIRLELEYIPASYCVIEHATHVYACRNCQTSAETTPIVNAVAPRPIFKGSLASASLLAQILCDKYLYHLPLYRQEAAFLHDGIALSRQTLANWSIKGSEDYLFGIYGLLKRSLLSEDVIHADETTLEVLKEPGRKAEQKSYMWLYRTSGCAKHPVVLYEYKPSRSHECPKEFLKGFSGYCHTDGYSGYHKLAGIKVVGCWAHARRRFDEALKGVSQSKQQGSLAAEGLGRINQLFELERRFEDLNPKERYAARIKASLPIAEGLFEWAMSANALPKSLIGKAISYLGEQREYLMRVFEDGRLELSNNRAERSIKPFVIGRKNWLFANTPKGADASAVIYSIIETAKENRLSVYEYLKYLFEKLPKAKTSGLKELLPWSKTLPSHVKVPAMKHSQVP